MNDKTADVLARYAGGERSFRGMVIDAPDEWLYLDGATLEGADFSESFLVGYFRNANLRNSRFHSANVKTCDFSGADLTNADFRGACLEATTFAGARMDGARFAGAGLWGVDMADGELPD